MDARVPLRPREGIEPGERSTRLVDSAHAAHEVPDLVDREARPSPDARVVRRREVLAGHVPGHGLESPPADGSCLEGGGLGPRILAGEDVEQVVVGPHHGELHALVVGRAQEPLVEGPLQVGAVVVPVVVEDEPVDPARVREPDGALGDGRIGLVLVPHGGDAGLAVPVEARNGAPDELPFGPPPAEPPLVAGVDVVVREVVRQDLGTRSHFTAPLDRPFLKVFCRKR